MMSLFWCIVFTLITYLMLHSKRLVDVIDIKVTLFMLVLCVVRLSFCPDFGFMRVIPEKRLLPALVSFLYHSKIIDKAGFVQVYYVQFFMAVWLIGALLHLAIFAYRDLRFRIPLSKERISDNPSLLKALDDVSSGHAGNVRIVETPLVNSPLVVGVFHPVICFPEIPFSREELYSCMSHEWHHILSKDLLFKYIINILCCVYWWNPIVFVLRHNIDISLEIKSDSNVTADMDEQGKIEYVSALKDIVVKLHEKQAAYSPSSLCFVRHTGRCAIEKRCYYILNHKNPSNRQRSFLTVCIVSMFALFMFSYAFIVQSVSEPSLTDGSSFTIDNPNDCFLERNEDGSYTLYIGGVNQGVLFDISCEPFSSMTIKDKKGSN